MNVENFCSSFLATASITTTASGAKGTASAASTTAGVTEATASASQSGSSTASPSVQTKSGAPASGVGMTGLWVAALVMVGAVALL
jgi:hypothetical protein